MYKIALYVKRGIDGKYSKKEGIEQTFYTKEYAINEIKQCFNVLREKSIQAMVYVKTDIIDNENEMVMVVQPVLRIYKTMYYKFTIEELKA